MAAKEEDPKKLIITYIGTSFALFLSNSFSLIPSLRSRNRHLYATLLSTEADLSELRKRRKEDSKANARVVEIFAGHRHAWMMEEKRLREEIERMRERVEELEGTEAELRNVVEELRREVEKRDEMLGFIAERGGGERGFGEFRVPRGESEESEEDERECCLEREGEMRFGVRGGETETEEYIVEREGEERRYGEFRVPRGETETEEYYVEREEISRMFSGSKRPNLWQDVQYESVEPMYQLKQFVSRREYPWKIDGETAGVSSKLKLLEQELLNLERIGGNNLSNIPSQLKKQAKRYQALGGKIDDLCRRMQASDPYGATMSPEFRTQRHTEFLLEAVRLQHRATETAQKLTALQAETGKSYFGNEVETTRRCLDLIKNNLKEIQRNLEIWLARIIGDLEGILARDGVSRVRDHYMSRYPFVQ